jgi:hypothetical protein
MRTIFSDLTLEAVEADRLSPGVFVQARKPPVFTENSLEAVPLFSIVNERRCTSVTGFEIGVRRCKYRIRALLSRLLPASVVARIIRLAGGGKSTLTP